MKIAKSSWIIVGVLLWGIPTGIFLSLFLSIIKPGTLFEMQPFQKEIFLGKLIIFIPVCAILGIFYGLFMNEISKKKSNL